MNKVCPFCGSKYTYFLDVQQVLIGIDDAVDVSYYMCLDCDKEWEV